MGFSDRHVMKDRKMKINAQLKWLLLGVAVVALAPSGAAQEPGLKSSTKVDRMFSAWKLPQSGFADKFRTTDESFTFPKELGWGDIPALLDHAKSHVALTLTLVNPLSSQTSRQCTEGMMALWLIEGIRKGGEFGSLNPWCYSLKRPGLETADMQLQVDKAYVAWWKHVKARPVGDAVKVDPLSGTGLRWY